MQTKKKAAFIDHSFHKETMCTVFLKELLSKTFELVEYYDESWNDGNKIDIDLLNKNEYEYIFYFQFIHKLKELKKLRNVKIVWFPMWDSVWRTKNSEWLKYQTLPIKIVCFSKLLYDKLHKLGFDCAYFQYFIDPQSVQPVTDYNTKRVYFWNRIEEINWDIVKKLLGNTPIDSFTFMAVPDPNYNPQIPSGEDIKRYNIQIYDRFLNLEEYLNLVSKANIYIAPRKFEGIGMTFLEALCRGQFVIAPNFATMNEYIVHEENGYLYDLNNLQEIDFDDFEIIGKEARVRAIEGYKKWQHQEIELIKFVGEFGTLKTKTRIIVFLKIKFLKTLELILHFNKKLRRIMSIK